MLLLNNMKAKILGLYSGYTNKGAPALLWGVATLVTIGIGLVLIAISVFSDALLSGPELAISAPSVDSSAPGIVFVVPTSLEADGLRIAWAVASSLVVFGIASILSAGASLVAGEYRTPIFRSSAGQTVRIRLATGMVLATFGGLIRELFLKERIAESAGIETVFFGEDHRILDWIYAIPWQVGLLLVFSFIWIWERGEKLQEEVDQVV